MITADIPIWMAVVIGLLTLAGSALSFLGCIGIYRFRTFYERVHAPTLGSTMGVTLISIASILLFWRIEGHLMPRELLIVLFITLTTPVTLLLLGRAALFRDRTERVALPNEPAAEGDAINAEAIEDAEEAR